MSETGKVFGLFDNGKAEWIRWMVAMAIGAGTVYASMNSRLSVVESRIGGEVTQAIDGLRDDIREVRAAVYTRQIQETTVIDDTPSRPARRPADDRLPRFGDDEALRAGRP